MFRTGSIGDWLVCLPALYAIRKRWASAELNLLTNAPLPGNPHVSEIIPGGSLYDRAVEYRSHPLLLPLELIRLRVKLCVGRDDILFCMRGYGSSGARRRRDLRTFRLMGFRRVLSCRNRFWHAVKGPDEPREPEWERLLAIARNAGAGVEMPRCVYPVRDEDARTISELLPLRSRRPRVAFCPLSKMPAKVWPLEHSVQILSRLIGAGAEVLLIGGPHDRRALDAMVASIPANARDALFNLAGMATVSESAAAMATCDCYFGVDSGPMHMAGVLGLPCVAVFSARDFGNRWMPYGTDHVVLRREVACAGCREDRCPVEGHPCMRQIGVEAAWEALKAKLYSPAVACPRTSGDHEDTVRGSNSEE